MWQPDRLDVRAVDWRGLPRPELEAVTLWYTAHLIARGALPPEPGPVRGDVMCFEADWEEEVSW